MTRLGRTVSLLSMLLLQSCTGSNIYTYGYYSGKSRPPAAATVVTPRVSSDVHIVAKGETLYSIAFAVGEDVRTVAAWNHIRPPYTIYPNQQIRVTSPPVTVTPRTRTSSTQTKPTPPPAPREKTYSDTSNSTNRKRANSQKISWQWPTNGKIIGTYAAKDVGIKGLDIAGKAGQPIYAAAGGMVVYSGDGLRGYGQLIIIKHDDTYFSAYAHNRRLLVKEDEKVNKGQHIADMGSTEADQTMLHFEVRRDGKPVDPLRYLPKRR